MESRNTVLGCVYVRFTPNPATQCVRRWAVASARWKLKRAELMRWRVFKEAVSPETRFEPPSMYAYFNNASPALLCVYETVPPR